jgi:hypothetical protein
VEKVVMVLEELTVRLEVQTQVMAVEVETKQAVKVALAVQALLSSKSPMPIVRHSLAVLPTLYRLQAQN